MQRVVGQWRLIMYEDETMLDKQQSDGQVAWGRAVGVSCATAVFTRSAGLERISITIAIRGLALFGGEVVV